LSSRGSEVGGSGWSMFAGVFLAIAGLFNALDGLVALIQKEYFNEAALVYQNMQVWGWVFLIVGIVQLVVGWQVISRAAWARWVGVVIAIVSMMIAFFAIGAYPWWALLIIVIDAIVVWGLTARWES
jgi:hypothetical protein